METFTAVARILAVVVVALAAYLVVSVFGWGGLEHLRSATIVAIVAVAAVACGVGWMFGDRHGRHHAG